jgi:hypothetical protein
MSGTVAGSLTGTTLATTPAEPRVIRELTTPRSSSAPTASPTAELQAGQDDAVGGVPQPLQQVEPEAPTAGTLAPQREQRIGQRPHGLLHRAHVLQPQPPVGGDDGIQLSVDVGELQGDVTAKSAAQGDEGIGGQARGRVVTGGASRHQVSGGERATAPQVVMNIQH